MVTLLTEQPEFMSACRQRPLFGELIARAKSFMALHWLESHGFASGELPVGAFDAALLLLLREYRVQVRTEAASQAKALAPDGVAAMSLVWVAANDNYDRAASEVDAILHSWGIPTAPFALDVYLLKVIEAAFGAGHRASSQVLFEVVSDPGDTLSATFEPPASATVEQFEQLIGEFLSTTRRKIRAKYLEPVVGRKIEKLEDSVRRNVRELYDHRVKGITLTEIARREYGDELRRKDVATHVRAASADLTIPGRSS